MEGVWLVIIHRLGSQYREVHSEWKYKWVAMVMAWWVRPMSIRTPVIQWHPDGTSWLSRKR